MSRYGNIDYIMELPWDEGSSLLYTARKKDKEKWLMLRWTIHYQSQMSFDEFKAKLTPKPISSRSREEILQEAYEIREKIEKQKEVISLPETNLG